MKPRLILDSSKFQLTIQRLCFQLIENHKEFSGTSLIGVQPRGAPMASRIFNELEKKLGFIPESGMLDPTFYRDDYRSGDKQLKPNPTSIRFSLEGKKVVLIDDVLYTGRTIRSALDALLDFGRPSRVELMVLIDRRFTRELPVQADYVGKTIDSLQSEKVKVEWNELDGADQVWIVPAKTDNP